MNRVDGGSTGGVVDIRNPWTTGSTDCAVRDPARLRRHDKGTPTTMQPGQDGIADVR